MSEAEGICHCGRRNLIPSANDKRQIFLFLFDGGIR